MSTLDKTPLVHHNGTSADEIATLVSNHAALVGDGEDGSYTVFFKDSFENLPPQKRVATALFLQRVKAELESESPWVAPSELTQLLDASMGTVYPALRHLEQESVVENRNGVYRIPGTEFSKLKSVLR
ncbi:single stranded DNA-binding domain-containing protein [Halorussus amylolyticus]|uniref:hypothetical protein n=1 Tax=Halorussus amylolyticus TaxID=1126242 RepID=UPI00138F411B|nr:hypothetical protein [Halorussus amylolyticus]